MSGVEAGSGVLRSKITSHELPNVGSTLLRLCAKKAGTPPATALGIPTCAESGYLKVLGEERYSQVKTSIDRETGQPLNNRSDAQLT